MEGGDGVAVESLLESARCFNYPQPLSGPKHLNLDNNPLKSYHVLDIKALDGNNPLQAKDLSSLGGPFYGQDYRN